MKILIVSDTHRQNGKLWKVIDKVKPIDMLIHCGDVEGDDKEIEMRAECPIHVVAGNNDIYYDLDDEQEFLLGRYKVLLVHGHRHHIYAGVASLFHLAKERGVDIVMFGHLHVPMLEQKNGITVLNPGSLTYPRQPNRRPSYIIMELDEKGEAHYTLNYL
ncbi:MAG TPA: metallophosphoesterase [Lachnospiraceae bacterium]|nr:metallophosphoesterase [Lachnospiraceae bacterium]